MIERKDFINKCESYLLRYDFGILYDSVKAGNFNPMWKIGEEILKIFNLNEVDKKNIVMAMPEDFKTRARAIDAVMKI